MIEAFLFTLVGVFAAQASPGPNLVAVASVALAEGRRCALFVVAGISSGMLVWSLGTAFGLAAILEAYPLSLLALRLVGGAYLIWLAVHAARAVIASQAVSIKPDHTRLSNAAAWRRGLLVVLTNPKAALMWAAVASFLFGAGLAPLQVLTFGPVGAVCGFIVYGTYAILFSTGLAARAYARAVRWIEALFATAFGALGGRLLWDGMAELRKWHTAG